MANVTFEKVVKRYPGNDKPTVKDLDLSIDDGEFLVLVGPSGCGKSTILRMVAGLINVSGGRIFIDGRDITYLPSKDRDVSMVFQNYALFPHMDVYNNIGFGLKIRRTERTDIENRVNEAAGLLGIRDLLKKRPRELSGGQRQRVAVGRAIVRNPKVFLFDEPLSNLDAKLRTQMRSELSKLHRKLGATTIYVTHDQSEAMTMADRMVVLHDGIIQQCGTPLGIYSAPQNTFVATFVGSPPMNLFDTELVTKDGRTSLQARDVVISPPAEIVESLKKRGETGCILGIRPEHIYLAERKPSGMRFGDPFTCEVELAESLGDEICLHCQAGGLTFQSTQKHDFAVRAGDRLNVVFCLDKLHVFDRTGNKIS